MKWRLWIVVLLIAASCSAPEPPDAWAIERFTDEDEDVVVDALCVDVIEFALGSFGDQPDLVPLLDDLARIGALAGATEALPSLGAVESTLADESLSDHNRFVRLHDLLVGAANTLDDATAAACEIPVFSAMYATSGFPDCHFELELPVAAYTKRREPGCTTDGRPDYLPCWSNDGNHIAVDCVTGVVVQTVGDDWREAGDPDPVVIDRVDPDAPPPPDVISLVDDAACRSLASLFTQAPVPNGGIPDFDRLRAAGDELPDAIAGLVDDFIAAATSPPSLAEFETLVRELDDATVERCGLPLVSAWATLTSTVDAMPCWLGTDAAYPAYEISDCA